MDTTEQRLKSLEAQMGRDYGKLWGVTSALEDVLRVVINHCESHAKVQIGKQLVALKNNPPISDSATRDFKTGYNAAMGNVLRRLPEG